VEGIDWSAVDDLSCGIKLEVSGDALHQPVHTDDTTDGKAKYICTLHCCRMCCMY